MGNTMWIIEKGVTTDNNILYNLEDDSTLVNPVYLFLFNKGNLTYPVILTDLSTPDQKEEYSRFDITEGVNDPTNGQVILGTTGVYDVIVYEQTSTTNLDPSNATYVQEFLARVNDAQILSNSYIEHVIDLTYIEHSVS